MTDRELLELAAKAAGIEGKYSEWMEMGEQHYAGIPQRDWGCWNPLTDDGDRYRLAKSCGLVVDFRKCAVLSRVGLFGWNRGDETDEAYAIVRAAAEIGREMP